MDEFGGKKLQNDTMDSFRSDEKFSNYIVVQVAQFCKFTKSHGIFYLKRINFMEYKSYPNTFAKYFLMQMNLKSVKW